MGLKCESGLNHDHTEGQGRERKGNVISSLATDYFSWPPGKVVFCIFFALNLPMAHAFSAVSVFTRPSLSVAESFTWIPFLLVSLGCNRIKLFHRLDHLSVAF